MEASIDHEPDLTLDITKDKHYHVGYNRCRVRHLAVIDQEIELLQTYKGAPYGIVSEKRLDIACQTLEELHHRLNSELRV